MRRLPLLLAAVPLVAAPAQAAQPLAATFAGIGWEICPASPGFPCSYEGHSLACKGVTIIDLRTPYSPTCATSLVGSVAQCANVTTFGTFTYRDDVNPTYTVHVAIRNGEFAGSAATEEGVVTVHGTLTPFAGTVTRLESAAPAPAAATHADCGVAS